MRTITLCWISAALAACATNPLDRAAHVHIQVGGNDLQAPQALPNLSRDTKFVIAAQVRVTDAAARFATDPVWLNSLKPDSFKNYVAAQRPPTEDEALAVETSLKNALQRALQQKGFSVQLQPRNSVGTATAAEAPAQTYELRVCIPLAKASILRKHFNYGMNWYEYTFSRPVLYMNFIGGPGCVGVPGVFRISASAQPERISSASLPSRSAIGAKFVVDDSKLNSERETRTPVTNVHYLTPEEFGEQLAEGILHRLGVN